MSYTNYHRKILLAAKDESLQGTVKQANFVSEISNFSCQDSIIITANVSTDGIITEILYEGNGCLLSRGSCALLLSYLRGKKIQDLAQLSLEEFFEIVPVEDRVARQECFLLGWRAFVERASKVSKFGL
jgi:NifU-like protein involved in Fe-S cluster formation